MELKDLFSVVTRVAEAEMEQPAIIVKRKNSRKFGERVKGVLVPTSGFRSDKVHFEFDPQWWLAFLLTYGEKYEIVGVVHNHPHGNLQPSETDQKYLSRFKWNIIVSKKGAALYRTVNGTLTQVKEGRWLSVIEALEDLELNEPKVDRMELRVGKSGISVILSGDPQSVSNYLKPLAVSEAGKRAMRMRELHAVAAQYGLKHEDVANLARHYFNDGLSKLSARELIALRRFIHEREMRRQR